jgi:hypothetical protein
LYVVFRKIIHHEVIIPQPPPKGQSPSPLKHFNYSSRYPTY